jgi:hypothetical protein
VPGNQAQELLRIPRINGKQHRKGEQISWRPPLYLLPAIPRQRRTLSSVTSSVVMAQFGVEPFEEATQASGLRA